MGSQPALRARNSRISRAFLAVAAVLLATGSAAGAQVLPAGETVSYRLGPKDQIAIKVYEVPELNVEVRVA